MTDTTVIEVELSALTYGGDCIGRLADGRAVFVPYGLPGERVRIQLVEEKRNYARAKLVEVLRPAAERISPRCVHFGVCGGCHYQHMAYDRQLAVKETIFREQLERIAGLANPPVDAIVASPTAWNYRNTIQLHLDDQGRPGFQGWGSHEVVAIRECHLPEDMLNDLWPRLDFEAQSGIEQVELRAGSGDDLLLVLESSGLDLPEFSVDLPLSAVHLSPGGKIILAGDDFIVMEVHGRPLRVSAESFFQVNTALAEGMVSHLLEALPVNESTTLLDVYCGVGLFSAFFADKAKRTIGVEISSSACDDYIVNLDEYERVELYVGAAEEVLPALQIKGGVAIVDPPRAGIDRRALDALVSIRPEVIAYVSCDPATLARDLKRLLANGYRLERATPFDLFPQTYHIESISLLRAIR